MIVKRPEWSKEVEYILACVGYAVGLGNLWRFPYLCYSSGGGAFLVAYFVMLILCGIPLLFMELAIGQFTKQGPVGAIKMLCPFFQGVGLSTVMLSFFLITYYNVIMAWALYFLFSSFYDPLPWSTCNNTWNEQLTCSNKYTMAVYNSTVITSSIQTNFTDSKLQSSTFQFFKNKVLQQSTGLDEPGTMQWELFGLLVVTWVLVYFCIFKGIKWTGKIVYFTATFPYLLIIIMLIYGLTLPGALKGVIYFIKPDWKLLLTPKVWVYAAAQNFNSIGIAFGSMIAFSSYSNQKNKVFRDCLFVCILNSTTSILAGFAVFSILGFISNNLGTPIEDLAEQGPGLVFQIYPEAFNAMSYPWANILAFLFFFNILCLGIDSQFASVEVVITTLEDHLNKPLMRIFRRKEILILFVCLVALFLGTPNVLQGGIYFFKVIDYYSSSLSLMLIAFFEVIAVTWFYGANRLSKNIAQMNGLMPSLYIRSCWYVFSPILILVIMVFNWSEYHPLSMGTYVFPGWAEILGWLIALASFICIPIGMIKALIEAKGDGWKERVKNCFKSEFDEMAIVSSYCNSIIVASDNDNATQEGRTKNSSFSEMPENTIEDFKSSFAILDDKTNDFILFNISDKKL